MKAIPIPKGFKLKNGWVWPAYDTDCIRVVFRMSRDLEAVLKHVPQHARKACIQAGGNCGVWPSILAGQFGHVYTAEPDPQNFVALVMNTAQHPNVTRLQAAFGRNRNLLHMELAPHEQANCGALYVQNGGTIPTLHIDDLNLPECGLIYLDIEGYEFDALLGARATIRRCQPIIVVEDKGLSEKYDVEKGDIEKWAAENFGYVVLERINKDVVLGPKNVG